MFSKYGPLSNVSIVYDQQSRRSRGFAFVYFENKEDSKEVCVCVCSRGWAAAALYFFLCVWFVLKQMHSSVCYSKLFCCYVFRLKSKLTAWSWTAGVSEWTFPSPRDHTPPHLGFTWDGQPSECTLRYAFRTDLGQDPQFNCVTRGKYCSSRDISAIFNGTVLMSSALLSRGWTAIVLNKIKTLQAFLFIHKLTSAEIIAVCGAFVNGNL